MSWKFILDGRNLLLDRNDYRELCRKLDYHFLCFNGMIYFIPLSGDVVDTGIKIKDCW